MSHDVRWTWWGRKHELEKKWQYEQCVREVEHASFTLLVLSATGGMANQATVFYKRLAILLALKWDQPYSSTMSWLRSRLTFSLLRSAIQSIRGARSSWQWLDTTGKNVITFHICNCPFSSDLDFCWSGWSGNPAATHARILMAWYYYLFIVLRLNSHACRSHNSLIVHCTLLEGVLPQHNCLLLMYFIEFVVDVFHFTLEL